MISGSCAALFNIVVPFANDAAISKVSVAPTLLHLKLIDDPSNLLLGVITSALK